MRTYRPMIKVGIELASPTRVDPRKMQAADIRRVHIRPTRAMMLFASTDPTRPPRVKMDTTSPN
jgi:hypothetical protein